MKKAALIPLLGALFLLAAACGSAGGGHGTVVSAGSSVSQIMEDAVNGGAGGADPVSPDSGDAAAVPPEDGDPVDLDLTQMNGNMIYAEVSHMMEDPEAYVGLTIRMEGLFSTYEMDDRIYYGCVIPDATACCMQGVEFVWAGDHTYPDDYPARWEGIRVTGVFDVYEEDGEIYGHVTNADMTVDPAIAEVLTQ